MVLVLCLLGLAACGDDTVAPVPSGSVELNFLAYVGADPLVEDMIQYTNAAGNEYSVENLLYYVSNVAFRGPEGSFESDAIHHVDASEAGTAKLMIPGVPERHYHKIEFTFGIDAEHNKTGALGTEPVHLNMQWPAPMGGGYHYMKLEGKFLKNGIPFNYLTHTGRLLETDGTQSHHFFTVSMDLHRNVVRDQTLHAEVIMDVNQWYENPNVIDLDTHSGEIMGNTGAQDLLEQNGASAFRLGDVDGEDDDGGM